MNFFVILLLTCLLILWISLQKTYGALPLKELKRRARSGHDELATAMYKAAGYGKSLRALLWFLIGLTSAGLFMSVTSYMPSLLALLSCAGVVWLGFVWMPATRVTKIGAKIAAILSPLFAWVLNYIHPIIEKVLIFIRKHKPITLHTGLYDVDDLVELIERQQVQTDNRIDKNGLDIALHALQFGDQLVRDHLVPRRVVKSVKVDDDIGPALMSELHDTGHSRFPVYEGKQDNLVGMLYLKDVVSTTHAGQVRDVMRPSVLFVHEEQTLYEALQAILKTHHHLFVVVNSFEEYVGIITMEDVLEQVIGRPIIDEFDQYDDLRAVASRVAREEHKVHQQSSDNQKSDIITPDEITE